MILLLAFAFLAGLVTILAPCIWPLLPIVLSSAAAGKTHARPLGITLGIMLSFTFFTLAISFLVSIFHLDPNIIRLFAVVVLIFLGLSMIIPALSRLTESRVSRFVGRFGTTGQSQGSDFGSGFVTGLSLGVVWTPCSGPILASIATLAATGQVTFSVVLVTLAYVTGVGTPLFIFAYGGQRVIGKTRFMSAYTGRVQQLFGVLMLLTAIAIYTNFDKTIQLKLLDVFPSYSSALTSFEKNSTVKEQLDILKGKKSSSGAGAVDASGLFNENKPAPEFIGITKWLNTNQPLTLKELKGKVVLVDFWTYTCINCIRTLPHVTSWYDKYKNKGFVVIGVHTPEFEFEKETKNVENAIKQYNIHYPVPQDNAFATWNNYNNQYWPAEYLIDAKGIIRRTHFGEGKYDETEQAIQVLLRESGQQVSSSLENMPDQTPTTQNSPETYLGSKRMQYYYPSGQVSNGQQNFTLSDNPPLNSFSYGGQWNITDETAVAGKNSVITYHFSANKVFLILRPGINPSNTATVKVLLDGKAIDAKVAGADVHNGTITIDTDRLYDIADLKGNVGDHILKLEFQTSGVEVYTFTFG
jgi:cytochrome c biogenesis protein CcdA/thiol-disulfide isomerase/thioredoxin